MRISFEYTKQYEVFIDKEDIDNCFGGDIEEAISENMDKAEIVDSYDIEVLDTDLSAEDEAYEEELEDEYRRERDLQESMYLRDLI